MIEKELASFKNEFAGHKWIKVFYGEKGSKRTRAFWNQFRIELMRLAPDKLKSFLESEGSMSAQKKTCLSEFTENQGSLAKDLAIRISDDPQKVRIQQAALILFCLNKEAALFLKELDSNKTGTRKDILKKALNVWEVP
jgi:hypothetical protein